MLLFYPIRSCSSRKSANFSMIAEIERGAMRRSFDAASGRYDSAARLQRDTREELLERLQILALAPETVLDLGSGPGAGTRALADRYPKARVIAADLSIAMLQEARRHAGLLRNRFERIGADA